MKNIVKQEFKECIKKYDSRYRITFPKNEKLAILDYDYINAISDVIAPMIITSPDFMLSEIMKALKKNSKYKDVEEVRIISLPDNLKMNISEISSKDIDELRTFKAMVRSIIDKSVVCTKAIFKCTNCKKLTEKDQDGTILSFPKKKCCKKPDFTLHSRYIEDRMIVELVAIDDEKKVIYEELPIMCFFKNHLLEENSKYLFPGARLEINGIVREKILEKKGKLTNFSEFFVIANDILSANQRLTRITWPKEKKEMTKSPHDSYGKRLLDTGYSFKDLIVDTETLEKLKDIVVFHVNKNKIFEEWRFKEVVRYGKGTIVNFTGPPGTGKTLAANVISNELGMEIIVADYSQLKNKYIGETEKNISKIFSQAKSTNSVLFFDEADAIALSRDNMDKSWEMSEINTLLRELENFEGVCIFATNYPSKYDSAFERRFTMQIDFKLPGKEECIKILDKLLPMESRTEDMKLSGLDLEGFSGGDLKNIALNSAGNAIKRNSPKIEINDINKAIELTKKSKKKSNLKLRNEYLG